MLTFEYANFFGLKWMADMPHFTNERKNMNFIGPAVTTPGVYVDGDAVAGITATDIFAALTDNGGGATADGTIGAIGVTRVGSLHLTAPDATSNTGGATQKDLNGATAGATMASIVQPDYPRNVRILVTDGNASISVFTITVVGVGQAGQAVSEAFVFADGLSQAGSEIFNTVTSVTVTAITGNGAADTLDIGYGSKFGLPVPATAVTTMRNLTVDGAEDAVSAEGDGWFTPTTAANASKNFNAVFSWVDPADTALRSAIKELSTQCNLLRTALVDTGIIV